MSEFVLQPAVYSTGIKHNLLGILEDEWIRHSQPGNGNFYIISGFGNYNGGVRFYSTFRRHIDLGGQVIAFFGGSTSQHLTSRQLIERLLNCGCEVYLVNRKRIFHSKFYGTFSDGSSSLVVTSGNFTGPGMSQNVESTVHLQSDITNQINFNWLNLTQSILAQNWEIYRPSLVDMEAPAWQLVFDERQTGITLEQTQLMTMVLTLGHADTVRINAIPGTDEAKGSQYFWLSKDCSEFFPPLTILNERGYKSTNSCLINIFYADLGLFCRDSRVTFEIANNVDFRLGTGPLRYTGLAKEGDIATISRISENNYEIRIFRQNTPEYNSLLPYATTFIGHKEKRIGYLENDRYEQEIGISLIRDDQF
ncbi:restriction endonuclease [Chloroflexota bacterium]